MHTLEDHGHSRQRNEAHVRWLTIVAAAVLLVANTAAGDRFKVTIEITADGSLQPCYVTLPEHYDDDGEPRPLLVSLHTWSGDVEQRSEVLEQLAMERGWIYLFPHFRGANKHPDACGSLKAQQDILDAVDWAQQWYAVDEQRIYLTGVSGGGHMTLLMVGRYPHVWTAASAWVGISDLVAWHQRHADGRYGEMIRLSCGGAPGDNRQVDGEYRARSPQTYLHKARSVPVDIAAGIHDGHQGSVPIRHSLEAFNILALANGAPTVSDAEIEQLSRLNGKLEHPRPSDRVQDAAFERKIHLRRMAGPARITIFEGGHEGIAAAAIDWLSRHEKPGGD
jgi:hypothetical protein